MGRRSGVLLVIILVGLGVLLWTNPVMAKFSYGDSRYQNFYIALGPVTSDVPSVIISQTTYGTEIYGDNKGIEPIKLTFERRSNGKFFYGYSTQTISHPSYGTLCEFTPMLETGEIIIKVFSESRVADSDESGADINVYNSTGLPVHFLIYGDDEKRPRVARIRVEQGLLRVNQQDISSGTWQGLPQVRIDNYPPPYHPLEVLMQSNGIDVAFSSDGSMLAMASKADIVNIYSTDDYCPLQNLDGLRELQRLTFSPVAGDNILAVGLWSEVRLFNLTSGITKRIQLNKYLNGFAFSPDGTQLATVSSETVQIWDTSSGTCLRTLEMSYIPRSVAFSPDWSMFACGYNRIGIELYDTSEGTLIRSLEPVPGKETSIYNLAFSPDGQKLAGYFHSDDYSQTGGICLWQLSDGSLLNRAENIITYHQRASCKLLFTPDSQHLVTLIDDVKFWNVPDLGLEYTISPARDISRLAISPNGQYLACLGIDRIELWQIGSVALPETGVRMTTCLDNMQRYRYLPLCYQVSAPEAVLKGRLYINDQVFEHDVGSWHQYNVITRWDKRFFSPGIYSIRYETEDINGNCQSSDTLEIQINGIKLSPRYLFPVPLTAGDEPVTLTAEFFSDSASDTLIWETSNLEVASLAENENSVTVTPLTPGKTRVSAKVADKYSASTGFIVYPDVNGITLDKSALVFGDGAVAGTLQATISPEDTLKQQVLWKSTDESVVRVEGHGLTASVTAVGSGEATIIVETEQGGYTANCIVTVPAGPLFASAQLYDSGSNGTGLRLIFDRDISPGSAYDSISLNDDNGQPVECTKTISGPWMDLVPGTGLQEGSSYSFIIPAASLKDNSGQSRPNSYQGQFIAVSSFDQNEGQGGYQAGMYEGYGIQPTEHNWTWQSRFNGGGGAEQKWSFATGGASPTPAVIGSDGTIYVSGDDGCLHVVNPDGSKKWAYYTGKGTSPVIGEDGTIYVGSEDGNLYAINPDGNKKWSYSTSESFSTVLAAPAIDKDGTIYFGSSAQHLYALNPDGTMKWSYYTDFGGAIFTTPAIASDGTIYATTNRIDKILYAINPDGSLKWSLDGIIGTPVIDSDGTIYVGEKDLYAINPDGTIKWTLAGANNSGIALSKDGNIYVGSGSGKVMALDLSGKQKWEYPVNGKPTGSPLIGADGTIYVASDNGQLYAINPDSSSLWQYNTGVTLSSSPSMGADGIICIAATNGNLYAFDSAIDTNVPVLTSANPPNGWEYVAIDEAITFVFNEKIQAGSAFDNITVMDDNNEPLAFNKEISGRTLIVRPANQWPYGTKCKIIIPVSAVNDLANNSLATESIYVFTTLDFLVNNQGPGYQAGAYDQGAVQPSTFNWNRQSRFKGSDSANQVWSYIADDSIYTSPAVGADGTIYVGSDDNNLYAIAPDGKKKWSFTTRNYINSSPVVGMYGCIYVGSYDKNLYAINPDGSKKWSFLTGDYIYSSPAIGANGTIYVGSNDKKLYAINTDGSQKWAFAAGGYISSSPAIGADGTIYVGSGDKKLYAINPDGSQKWAFAAGGYISSSPAIGADGTIYVGSDDKKLYAINPDGTQKWSFITGRGIYSSPAIGADGTIYIGSHDQNFYAINPDGSQKWSFATGNFVYSSPIIGADGTIYVGSADKKLYALNPDGSMKWSFTAGDYVSSSPAIDDGVVYVCSGNALYCIGTDQKAPLIVGTDPVKGSNQAAVCQNIFIHFNEILVPGPSYDLISIKDEKNNVVSCTKDIDSSTLILKPDKPLNAYTQYFVSIPSNAVADMASNNFAADYEFSFTTWAVFSNNQGAGYQPGAYDQEAAQPTAFNWSRQSRYIVSSDPIKKWSFATNGDIYSSPTVGADGTIYVGSSDKNLYAITPDGRKKWSFLTGGDVDSSPAIGADGTIYVGSDDKNLYAINPDGSKKWFFLTGGYIYRAPAVGADGTIYVISAGKNLYAINSYGSLKWSYAIGVYIYSSPAIGADGTIYVVSSDGDLHAINPDGTQKWFQGIGSYVDSSPAIGLDGTIYIGSKDGNLYAISPDGTMRWSFATGDDIYTSPVIGADGTIFIGSDDWNLYAINQDGSRKWSLNKLGQRFYSSPAISADGTIYIGSSYDLYAIGGSNGAPEAVKVIITGQPQVGETLIASYTYQDNENDPEGQSIFKWYRCANAEGIGKEEIPGAGDLTYTLTTADEGIYLFFEITPVAAAGTLTGTPLLSTAYGPVSGSPEEDPLAAKLTGLSIREGSDGLGVELIPGFDGNNLSQSLIVSHDIEAVTVVPVVAANITARVQVVCGENITEITNGVVALDYGINTINVVVSEEGKTDRTYTITVNRNTVDECFIATAAYGSKLAPGVVLLRSFRDQYLLTNTLGRAFVEYYYHNSPPIAAYISRHEPLKAGVRVLLLPAIGIAYTAFHPSILVLAIFLLGTLVLYRKKYSTK